MFPTRHGRPALRRLIPNPTLGLTPPDPKLFLGLGALAPSPNPIDPPNNNLFQEFIWTFIERVQALTAPAALITEAKDDTNRPLKPWNLDLYYGHLYMECYYFCQ